MKTLNTFIENSADAEKTAKGVLIEPRSRDARNKLISTCESEHVHYSLPDHDILIRNTNVGLCDFLTILLCE